LPALQVLLLLDKDSQTNLSEDLQKKIVRTLESRGHQVDIYKLEKGEVFQCLGCLLCLTKHPDHCFNKDLINDLRKNVKQYSATFFLTPVLFGHYSSTMAGAINRGTGSHDWQVFIGYGEDISVEEKQTFIDLVAKHRGAAEIVHPGMDRKVDVFVTMSPEESTHICEVLSYA
jgi:multimeric flavodoxin WrbA